MAGVWRDVFNKNVEVDVEFGDLYPGLSVLRFCFPHCLHASTGAVRTGFGFPGLPRVRLGPQNRPLAALPSPRGDVARQSAATFMVDSACNGMKMSEINKSDVRVNRVALPATCASALRSLVDPCAPCGLCGQPGLGAPGHVQAGRHPC